LKGQVQELQAAIEKVSRESTEYQVELGKRDQQVDTLTQALDGTEKSATAAGLSRRERKQLEGQVKELQTAIEKGSRESTEYQVALGKRDQQVAALTQALEVAEKSAAAEGLSLEQRKQLESQVKELQAAIEKVSRESSEYQVALGKRDQQVDALTQAIDGTERLDTAAGLSRRERKQLEGQVKELRGEFKDMTRDNKRLSDDVADLAQDVRTATSAKDAATKALKTMAAKVTADQKAAAKSAMARRKQTELLRELDEKLSKSSRSISELSQENELLVQSLKRTENSRDEALSVAESAQQSAAAVQVKLATLTQAQADEDAATVSQRQQLEQLRADNAALSGDIAALRSSNQALQSKSTKLNQLVDDLRGSNDPKYVNKLQDELTTIRAAESERRGTMEGLFTQLAVAKGALGDAESRRKKTETELADAHDQSKQLQNELTKATAAHAPLKQVIANLRQEIKALGVSKYALQGELADKGDAVDAEVAKLQALQAEIDQLAATDRQRRLAMDELLEKMGGMELDGQKVSAELTATRSRLSKEVLTLQGQHAAVALEKGRLASELSTLEGELAKAVSTRDSLQGDAEKSGAAESALRQRKTELEALLEEQRGIDTQRKRNMDRLLGDLAKLEAGNASAQAQSKSLAQQLAAALAAPVTATLETGDATATAKALSELQQVHQVVQTETLSQKERIRALEAQLATTTGAATTPVPAGISTADSSAAVETALVAARQTWEAEAATQAQHSDTLTAERAQLERENEDLRKKIVNVRDTDLFKQLEKANVVLRDKVVKIEEERQTLQSEVGSVDKEQRGRERELRTAKSEVTRLGADLTAAAEREGEHRTLIEKLMIQMPELEQDVVQLQDSLAEKETLLAERTRVLEALKVEMEKREHRLQKAQMTAQILEDAREDVVHSSDREKRDMHYNMAMVYSREKRHADAEGEYLKALQLDATDADSHYNLAILYDDELESPGKAVVHYKRYLKLSPHGPDADAVRSWLMKLETK
jgi:chromosome segregation ATPase